MIYTEDQFRPTPQYQVYPPYHQGDYLEDYFYNKFVKENPEVSRDYIAVSWTTLYCDNKTNELQPYLNTIPSTGKYFTISQHDDAPEHGLPPNTLCFSAGGNAKGSNIIPIPLVCSKLPIQLVENMPRKLLASFVGSNTHPIRMKMFEACKTSTNIAMYMRESAPNINNSEFEIFVNVTANSKFALCPRGYGLNSFRLYEAMQLQTIPVIITNDRYLPWEDELNWEEFSVFIGENQIPYIPEVLAGFSDEQVETMRTRLKKVYEEYFSLDGVYTNIIKRIK